MTTAVARSAYGVNRNSMKIHIFNAFFYFPFNGLFQVHLMGGQQGRTNEGWVEVMIFERNAPNSPVIGGIKRFFNKPLPDSQKANSKQF